LTPAKYLVSQLHPRMKSMRFGSGLGANHSDASGHREDLQRRHESKGAISCGRNCETGY
jgi:hypothetical protein